MYQAYKDLHINRHRLHNMHILCIFPGSPYLYPYNTTKIYPFAHILCGVLAKAIQSTFLHLFQALADREYGCTKPFHTNPYMHCHVSKRINAQTDASYYMYYSFRNSKSLRTLCLEMFGNRVTAYCV